MLKINNKTDEAEIYISGDIVDDADGNFIAAFFGDSTGYQWPSNIKAQLDDIDDEQPLTVYINSDGGSVPAGVAIAHMIARHKGHTKCVVDGWAASIASQIFLSADERIIPENAYLMIHKPSSWSAGTADDHAKTINALDAIQEGLENTYNAVAVEGVSRETIHEMVEAETWLTGTEAAKYFNVTVIPATNTAAHFGKAFDRSKLKPPDGIVFNNEVPQADTNRPTYSDKEIEKIKMKAYIAMMGGFTND